MVNGVCFSASGQKEVNVQLGHWEKGSEYKRARHSDHRANESALVPLNGRMKMSKLVIRKTERSNVVIHSEMKGLRMRRR